MVNHGKEALFGLYVFNLFKFDDLGLLQGLHGDYIFFYLCQINFSESASTDHLNQVEVVNYPSRVFHLTYHHNSIRVIHAVGCQICLVLKEEIVFRVNLMDRLNIFRWNIILTLVVFF